MVSAEAAGNYCREGDTKESQECGKPKGSQTGTPTPTRTLDVDTEKGHKQARHETCDTEELGLGILF